MKKTSKFSGKTIAVLLIIAFLGINYFKSSSEVGPQEQIFAEKRQQEAETRKVDDKIASSQNVQKLKYAYTGKWDKNAAYTAEGKYNFETPENQRNSIEAVAAAKKVDAKKAKKLADRKKKKTSKIAKKKYRNKNGRSLFDSDDYDQDDYGRTTYFQRQEQRAPSDNKNLEEEKEEKSLTAEEWFTKVTAENSLSTLASEFRSGKVKSSIFYSVVEMLLSSEKDSNKKLGFQALELTPSVASLQKYATHIDDEMSVEVKTYAESTIKIYNDPNQIRTLNSALNSKDSNLKIIAANLIREITTKILTVSEASGQNTTYTQVQLDLYKRMLTQSLNVINNALAAGVDATVVASFNSTRAILQEFLG